MKFGPGDLVKLVSGGPNMMVEEFSMKPSILVCVWFDATGFHRENINDSVLTNGDKKE